MRKLLVPLVAVVVLSGRFPLRAADEPAVLIDKAVQALGGQERLSKHKAGTTKTKGSLELMGGLTFTQQITVQHPSQFKEVMDLEVNGQKVTVTTVYDGMKGWINVNGMTRDADDKILAELKEAGHLMRVARLITLKDNKTFELAPLGEVKVDGKDAAGIRVSSKGFRDCNIYFDKKTALPVKIERRVFDFMSQQDVNEERIILEYQEKDGFKTAKKVLVQRDGKKLMEIEILEIKLLDKIDDSEFAKP